MKILIVGGVAGGATAAARLRRLNEQDEIIVFERGEYVSFANCGLPYYIGGVIPDSDKLLLQTPESFYERFRVEVRTNCEVTEIDREQKCVSVKRGSETYTEPYDKLILSPGAEPFIPGALDIQSKRIFTLRNMADTFKIKNYAALASPKRAVILGGGYVGIEMAENLAHLGIEVYVIELADQILSTFDLDMVCDVQNYLRDKGLHILTGTSIDEAIEDEDGLILKTSQGEMRADILIAAAGVRPETAMASACGLETSPNGGIHVNESMQTSDPDIYAVGDAVETKFLVSNCQRIVPLAGPANKQARIAANHIAGRADAYHGTQGSAIIKLFDMTAACTGLTEREAMRSGIPYEKVFTFSPSHATYYPNASNMSIKTLYDPKDGKILGAQIVGYEGVDKRCDIMAVAVRLGLTANQLCELELCYAPPFSSAKDPVNMAGFVIQNTQEGLVKNFQWHDIASLPDDGSIVRLDVRTKKEVSRGAIPGFMNIPLDELRENLHLLDRNKPIYVHCQSGLRSYIACRILSGNGYDCYNLSGGYRLWASIQKNKEAKNVLP